MIDRQGKTENLVWANFLRDLVSLKSSVSIPVLQQNRSDQTELVKTIFIFLFFLFENQDLEEVLLNQPKSVTRT